MHKKQNSLNQPPTEHLVTLSMIITDATAKQEIQVNNNNFSEQNISLSEMSIFFKNKNNHHNLLHVSTSKRGMFRLGSTDIDPGSEYSDTSNI